MKSILKHKAGLTGHDVVKGKFVFRFAPVFPAHKLEQPILRLFFASKNPIDPKTSIDPKTFIDQGPEILALIEGQVIEDIEVSGDNLLIWLDGELKPHCYKGFISWQYEGYQSCDRVRINKIQQRARHLAEQGNGDLGKSFKQGLNLIDKTIGFLARKH